MTSEAEIDFPRAGIWELGPKVPGKSSGFRVRTVQGFMGLKLICFVFFFTRVLGASLQLLSILRSLHGWDEFHFLELSCSDFSSFGFGVRPRLLLDRLIDHARGQASKEELEEARVCLWLRVGLLDFSMGALAISIGCLGYFCYQIVERLSSFFVGGVGVGGGSSGLGHTKTAQRRPRDRSPLPPKRGAAPNPKT